MIKQQKLLLLSGSEEAADVTAFTAFKAVSAASVKSGDKAGAAETSEETLNFLIVQ